MVGIGWDMVGAVSAATFYVPISKVRRWSWETTWAVAGFFSWLLVPVLVSLALLPNFGAFYAGLDAGVVAKVFVFGALWGVGNVNYGLTMRYLGMSLGIGVAIGVTMAVGTLMPPILHGQGATLVTTPSGLMTLAGIVVALLGVAIVSYAGYLKEQQSGISAEQFDLKKGLILAVICGIFSACMSFAIDAATPITTQALKEGVPQLYSGLPSYVIIMAGGALVNFAYCIFRLATRKELSIKADMAQPAGRLALNGVMAAVGGIMWYLQFFFLAWGKASIPAELAYVNWMLLMSGCVACGGLVGLALGEWQGVGSKPVRVLLFGTLVIIAAANIVGLGMKM